jgi:hypothetical protein
MKPTTAQLNQARAQGLYRADYVPVVPAPGTATQQAHNRLRGVLPRCGFTECGDGAFYLPAKAGMQETRVVLDKGLVLVQTKRPGRQWIRVASARYLDVKFNLQSVTIGDATYTEQS